MVKIENTNLEKIALQYFDKIKGACIEKSKFYLLLFDVLRGLKVAQDLANDKTDGGRKKSLANILLLPAQKINDQHNYAKVTFGNSNAWVQPNINNLIAIADFLKSEENLKKVVLCKPADCYQLDLDLRNRFNVAPVNQAFYFTFINSIINYDSFKNYSYWLGSQLEVNTCPYCNRVPIHTIIDKEKEIITSTFDHFYPQSGHPFLALSFYNLIPSCYYCNSNLKGASVMNISTHLHPYIDKFGNDVKFRVMVVANKPSKSDPENYYIFFQSYLHPIQPKYRQIFGNSNKEGNMNLFELKAIYQAHRDRVGEIIVNCDRYSRGQADSLQKLFGLLNANRAEFYQYYFGNYFNEKDFNKRPLAKLTRDIVEQELPHF